MPPLSVMIKPASADCNLHCDYCFYRDLASRRSVFSKGRMNAETVVALLSHSFSYAKGSMISFTFQGGEPLLAGYEFYDMFFNEARKRAENVAVSFFLQTNGTLLNEQYCNLFRENNVLIGLSLDGIEKSNCHRKTASGDNAFDDILAGANLLKQYGVEFNVLSVVTKEVAENIDEIYDFFKAENFRYLQFIPCLAPSVENGREDASAQNYAPDNLGYADFLLKLFDRYERDFYDGTYVSERRFDNYVRLLISGKAEQCGMNGICAEQFVVEADGSVYPCDFYAEDRYYLGNIIQNGFNDLKNETQRAFLAEKLSLKSECTICPHVFLCRSGGCKREAPNGNCDAYRIFFDACTSRLIKIAHAVQNSVR